MAAVWTCPPGFVAAAERPGPGVLRPVGFDPIGIIRSEHVRPEATPIQPVFARGRRGHRRGAPGDMAAAP